MIDIKYKQEKVSPLTIVFPGVFIVVGLIVFFFILISSGFQEFLISLFPLAFVAVGGFMMYKFLSEAKKQSQEIQELRTKGRMLYGEVLDIKEDYITTHDGDGDSHRTYFYNFIVKYDDPNSFESITVESTIPTYTKYTLLGPKCQIRVLNGTVLVEKAEVEVAKMSVKQIVTVVIFILIFAIFGLGKFFGWF